MQVPSLKQVEQHLYGEHPPGQVTALSTKPFAVQGIRKTSFSVPFL